MRFTGTGQGGRRAVEIEAPTELSESSASSVEKVKIGRLKRKVTVGKLSTDPLFHSFFPETFLRH